MTWEPAATPPPLGKAEVHVWRLPAAAGDLSAFEQILSEEERQRASRFAFAEPRERYIRARGCLRSLLAAYVGARPDGLELTAGRYGKPRLTRPASDIHFNLSHSGNAVLLAFARRRHVGVDVERLQRRVDWQAVAGRFFEEREVADLQSLPDGVRRDAFFRAWTRKEAFLKATGKGVVYGLTNVRVSLRPADPPAIRWLADGSQQNWGLEDADPDDEHVGAVCARGRDWEARSLEFAAR